MTDLVFLSFDHIVDLNARHGGPGAGLRDGQGLSAQLGRLESGFGGIDPFPSVWDKAALLIHGIAGTQSFLDGNKRTAWLAAVLFLNVNDSPLRDLPETHAEAFVLAVATGVFTVGQAAEWFYDARVRAKDRLQFADSMLDAQPISNGSSIMDLSRVGFTDFELDDPKGAGASAFQFVVYSRWVFVEADNGRRFAVTYEARSAVGGEPPYVVHPLWAGPDIILAADQLLGDGKPTAHRLAKDLVLVVHSHGEAEVVLKLDGEEAGVVRMSAHARTPLPPDDLSGLGPVS